MVVIVCLQGKLPHLREREREEKKEKEKKVWLLILIWICIVCGEGKKEGVGSLKEKDKTKWSEKEWKILVGYFACLTQGIVVSNPFFVSQCTKPF